MRSGIQVKHWFFTWYWAVSLVLGAVLCVAFLFGLFETKVLLTCLGILLPFVYFVQKQKLEELRLFRDLFAGFNERYDEMNEDLDRILNESGAGPIHGRDREVLIDYFNLCGEEYLYFSKGYVYPEVWEAWLNGMRVFYESEHIRPLWDDELATGSYYGLGDEIGMPNTLPTRRR